MRCPFCNKDNDKVVDSRSSEGARVIRRRRQCLSCNRRFTTYEKVGENSKLNVAKRDASRVPYDREKVLGGIQKACYKRKVSADKQQEIADKVETDIFRNFDKEVSSLYIGDCVMRHLREADKVAYIRFASVYREFSDAGQLIEEVSEAIKELNIPDQKELFTD